MEAREGYPLYRTIQKGERQAPWYLWSVEARFDQGFLQLRHDLDLDAREKLERLDATHKAQAEAQRLRRQQEQTPPGITGLFSSIRDFFSPARAAEREADLRREQDELGMRQKQERDQYAALLQQTNALEIENFTERHELQLQDHATKGEEDLDRYLREQEAARQLQAEFEEQERQRENELNKDGPKWPPPFIQ